MFARALPISHVHSIFHNLNMSTGVSMKKKYVITTILLVIAFTLFLIIGNLYTSPYINSYYALTQITLLEITSPFNDGYIQYKSNPLKFILKSKDETKFVSEYFDEYSENEIKGVARRGDTFYKYKFAPLSGRYSIGLLEELPSDHPDIPK